MRSLKKICSFLGFFAAFSAFSSVGHAQEVRNYGLWMLQQGSESDAMGAYKTCVFGQKFGESGFLEIRYRALRGTDITLMDEKWHLDEGKIYPMSIATPVASLAMNARALSPTVLNADVDAASQSQADFMDSLEEGVQGVRIHMPLDLGGDSIDLQDMEGLRAGVAELSSCESRISRESMIQANEAARSAAENASALPDPGEVSSGE